MTRGGDFWTRRRAAVAAEVEADLAEREAAGAARDRAALEEKTDAEILAELGLKDPDALERGDDFSAFLRPVVPERLRRRALRRLWNSNPVLANLDGLNDYDGDFTDAATVVTDLRTAYQVGKGIVARRPEAAATEVAAREAALEDVDPLAALRQQGAPASALPPETPSRPERPTEQATRIVGEADRADAPVRRRMRFDFAQTTSGEET